MAYLFDSRCHSPPPPGILTFFPRLRHWIAPAYVAKREAAHALSIAASYAEWREAAAVLDKLEGGDAWKMSPEDDAYVVELLHTDPA